MFLLLSGARTAGAEDVPLGEGELFVRYWSPRDFHGTTQTFSITQDRRGVMYFANQDAVQEYDGSTWRRIPIGSGGYVAGLAYEAGTDTVFAGTQDDLGYLKTEPGGAHAFVSLRDRLPADEIELLRKLSRRGDTVGIRRHLDAWRTAGDPARTGELTRRLEALLAAYDLDGIDALLLSMQPHADARH